jgi:hypothetical protein
MEKSPRTSSAMQLCPPNPPQGSTLHAVKRSSKNRIALAPSYDIK